MIGAWGGGWPTRVARTQVVALTLHYSGTGETSGASSREQRTCRSLRLVEPTCLGIKVHTGQGVVRVQVGLAHSVRWANDGRECQGDLLVAHFDRVGEHEPNLDGSERGLRQIFVAIERHLLEGEGGRVRRPSPVFQPVLVARLDHVAFRAAEAGLQEGEAWVATAKVRFDGLPHVLEFDGRLHATEAQVSIVEDGHLTIVFAIIAEGVAHHGDGELLEGLLACKSDRVRVEVLVGDVAVDVCLLVSTATLVKVVRAESVVRRGRKNFGAVKRVLVKRGKAVADAIVEEGLLRVAVNLVDGDTPLAREHILVRVRCEARLVVLFEWGVANAALGARRHCLAEGTIHHITVGRGAVLDATYRRVRGGAACGEGGCVAVVIRAGWRCRRRGRKR